MNKAIEQKVEFKGATAAELFDIFVDPEKHSAIHGGAEAKISAKEGDTFSLMNGNLTGKNLMIVPNKMIVQSWKGSIWEQDDPDSILSLIFSDTKDGAQIDMVHAFTPEQFPDKWEEIYWTPIREYLSKLTKA